MTREVELKFAVEDVARLTAWLDEHLFPLSSGRWREVEVTDRYIDTAGGALAAAGYGARLRRRGGITLVGVKSTDAVSRDIHDRLELEAPAADSLLPRDWPPSEARELVRSVAGENPLAELFVLRQWRRERELTAADHRCLLSIDLVSVERAGRRLAGLQQLEVELLAGDRSRLVDLGRRITASGLVRPEPRSKMDLAAALVEADSLTQP